MRRSNVLWGFSLILLGILFLLQNLNLLPPTLNLWGLFWPLVLIGLGGWTLWSVFGPRQALTPEAVTIPLAGAQRASGGVSSTNIDTARFPRRDGFYQSPDYETAPHRADIKIEMDAGSVTVK